MTNFADVLDTEMKRREESSGGPSGLAGGGLHEQAEFMRAKEEKAFREQQATLAKMKRENPELWSKVTGNKIKEAK